MDIIGNNSHGFANEREIIDYINRCHIYDNLNINFRSFLTFLYNSDLSGLTISADKPRGQVKPDIAITINGLTQYISVKNGSNNSVHQEKLTMFESFLINNSVSPHIINYIKEFHYGDGSIDGNGGTRINAANWQSQNPEKISQINHNLNSPTMLCSLFNKFLFVGNLHDAPVVDAMYHGNITEGLWANRDEIIHHLLSIHNNSNNIHFSNLNYQVWNRGLNHNPATAERRHVMQIKWSNLTNDLLEIQRNRQ